MSELDREKAREGFIVLGWVMLALVGCSAFVVMLLLYPVATISVSVITGAVAVCSAGIVAYASYDLPISFVYKATGIAFAVTVLFFIVAQVASDYNEYIELKDESIEISENWDRHVCETKTVEVAPRELDFDGPTLGKAPLLRDIDADLMHWAHVHYISKHWNDIGRYMLRYEIAARSVSKNPSVYTGYVDIWWYRNDGEPVGVTNLFIKNGEIEIERGWVIGDSFPDIEWNEESVPQAKAWNNN